MNEPKHPSVIAREALKRLATSQLAPTPANYQACYNEIANIPNVGVFPEAQLRELMGELPARNAEQEQLLDKLSAAITKRSWQGVKESLAAFAQAGESRFHEGTVLARVPVLPSEFAGKLARFVECVLPALGEEDSRVLSVASELLVLLRQPSVDIGQVQALFGSLTHQAVFAAEEQVEIKDSLLKLLHLIIENIGELSTDDNWLKGQVDGLLASVAPPLTLRHLDEMERRLRDVMEKQGRAKSRSVEAQAECARCSPSSLSA